MNRPRKFHDVVLLCALIGGFVAAGRSGEKEIVFVQLNDVYEIGPLQGGRYGGMARVASVVKSLRAVNPSTYLVVAGDFLSPSAIGTSAVNGKRISGAQMVEVLNLAGADFVTFGNHEFDIKETEVEERINESRFAWVSANVRHMDAGSSRPFRQKTDRGDMPVPASIIIAPKDSAGVDVRIGVIGVTTTKNAASYVQYEDPLAAARRTCDELKGRVDLILAITHLSIDQDQELARRVPELILIMGGHEHTNMTARVGETVITKADANARTAYIHHLRFDPGRKSISLVSELKVVDESLPEDSATANAVNKWTAVAFQGFEQLGFHPRSPVATLARPLDGREGTIRYAPSALGRLICRAMLETESRARVAILNTGSIRLDDELSGAVSEYDIIRTLPFGGKILVVEMKGSLLRRILDAGLLNRGSGGYLQAENATRTEAGSWTVDTAPLDEMANYPVMVTEYLLTGKEVRLDFLTRNNPDIIGVSEPAAFHPNDIRMAVINYLRERKQ